MKAAAAVVDDRPPAPFSIRYPRGSRSPFAPPISRRHEVTGVPVDGHQSPQAAKGNIFLATLLWRFLGISLQMLLVAFS